MEHWQTNSWWKDKGEALCKPKPITEIMESHNLLPEHYHHIIISALQRAFLEPRKLLGQWGELQGIQLQEGSSCRWDPAAQGIQLQGDPAAGRIQLQEGSSCRKVPASGRIQLQIPGPTKEALTANPEKCCTISPGLTHSTGEKQHFVSRVLISNMFWAFLSLECSYCRS